MKNNKSTSNKANKSTPKKEKTIYVAASKKETQKNPNKVVYKGSRYDNTSEPVLSETDKQKIRQDPYVYLVEESLKAKHVQLPLYVVVLLVLVWVFIFFCIMQFVLTNWRYPTNTAMVEKW